MIDYQNQAKGVQGPAPLEVVLSFDVEEHFRIEAASGLDLEPGMKERAAARVAPATRWLLDRLGERGLKATFFVVGTLARTEPGLIREIAAAGHEVASHGWDHRRLHMLTPASFREDLRTSRDALAQVTGEPVWGYRAPTFSLVRRTAWALDVLAESGLLYDSSIYPVRHDRYGVPRAPRGPFLAQGRSQAILELPPLTLRLAHWNLPVGGGGYFRLFPPGLMSWGLRQTQRGCVPPVAMLYFHPWEFDPGQERLPLGPLRRFRTYVGISRSQGRLTALFSKHPFTRALDVARTLDRQRPFLPRFDLGAPPATARPDVR